MTNTRPSGAVMDVAAGAATRGEEREARGLGLPFLFVLGYVLVDYGRPQNWVPTLGILRPGALALAGALVSLLVTRHIVLGRPGRYALGFLAVMALGVPFAYNNFTAFVMTRDFALLLFGAMIPLMTFTDNERRLNMLVRFWLAMHVSLALFAMAHGGRGIGSFLGDENDLALAMNLALPVGLFLLFATRSAAERLFLLAGVMVFLVATASSMSRGGFIGLVAVGLYAWLRMPRRVLGTGLVAALVAAFLVFAPASYWNEIRSIRTADEQGDTGYNRLYLWGIAWRMFKDNPVLGVGPGNFPYQSSSYESEDEARRGFHVWGRAAHSLYFTLLSETGVAGTLMFAGMVVAAWRLRRSVRRRCRALGADLPRGDPDAGTLERLHALSVGVDAAMVAYLVTGAFLTVLYYPHAWILTAFTVALGRVVEVEAARLEQRGSVVGETA